MSKEKGRDNILVRAAGIFFRNWRYTLLAWLVLLASGSLVYTKLIQREGFPAIQFPLSVVSGTYFVEDVDRIDSEIMQPLSAALVDNEKVDTINTTAGANFFSAQVFFDSGVSPAAGTQLVADILNESTWLPEQANFEIITIDPAAFLNKYDMLLSVYSADSEATVQDLEKVADFVAAEMELDSRITDAEPQYLTSSGVNPATGEDETRQTNFNRIGLRDGDELTFYPAVTVGIDRDQESLDIIELSELMQEKIQDIDFSRAGVSGDFAVTIGADFAESIDTQITSLQDNLLTGLVAVAATSFLLITWRASIITGIFMVTVMATTVLVLYLVGYTLNTITLFALVLSLGLFVDDATIVVEAIDASKNKKRKVADIVRNAIRKIGAASFAGTFTTVLVFLPLAFLSGILGEFIRLMPVTIIIALISSLILSLTVIPLLSRFILLRNMKKSWVTKINPVAHIEELLSRVVGGLPRLLKTRPAIGKIVAFSMFSLSIAFLMGAGFFASKISFNIFPPTKDSDQIGLQVRYPEGFTLQQAEEVASQLDGIIVDVVQENAVRVTYGSFDQPNARSADALVELVPFSERDVKSPEIIAQLDRAISERVAPDISVQVIQYDAGPPAEEFPLAVQIRVEDPESAYVLAQEVLEYIEGASVKRVNGSEARITETRPPARQIISRVDGTRTLEVRAAFDADDTSALLSAAQEYVEDYFTAEYLEERGYAADALGFDFGQESENAESFASLAWAFPLALLLMYLLLAVQFRSMLQPLLIFMAIPFTFFGVFLGLYLTDNALSFFVQVGLVGLIGIAVNNTILLTDYANQERREGHGAIDAIANAAAKRFRPLLTTTLTTVVALLPLALSDPFWEALAYTIIFGLISSTFLVLLSFPYYYLLAEWLRGKVRRAFRRLRRKTA
jgi:multidrug efflux pump subunit AcrB